MGICTWRHFLDCAIVFELWAVVIQRVLFSLIAQLKAKRKILNDILLPDIVTMTVDSILTVHFRY